jgi:3-oxoacyl-[acyl-carrier-protein] synthase-3
MASRHRSSRLVPETLRSPVAAAVPVSPQAAARPDPASPSRLPRGAAVLGVGTALPPRAVASADIAARLGVTERWIESRTGVMERRFADPDARLSDLAAAAGAEALSSAAVSPDELDLVVVATCTADDPVPASAPSVAGALGATRAAAFDVNAACTGFLSALDLACAQVESGRADRALVVGADLMSRLVNPDDKRTAALFGDGAGAVVVGASGSARVAPALLRSDAAGASFIHATHAPASLVMDGHETFKAAVGRLSDVTLEALEAAGWRTGDVDLFVYHQANARILRAVGERLELPPERVMNAIGSLGNTSAASIPLALAFALRDGLLQPGMRVLLAAFGAGFTWGATTLVWGRGDE